MSMAIFVYQFRLAAYHLSIVDRYPSLQVAATEHGTRPAAA
jgi:hypothetical protein